MASWGSGSSSACRRSSAAFWSLKIIIKTNFSAYLGQKFTFFGAHFSLHVRVMLEEFGAPEAQLGRGSAKILDSHRLGLAEGSGGSVPGSASSVGWALSGGLGGAEAVWLAVGRVDFL